MTLATLVLELPTNEQIRLTHKQALDSHGELLGSFFFVTTNDLTPTPNII